MDEDIFSPKEFTDGFVSLIVFITILVCFKIILEVQPSEGLSQGERLILILISGFSLIFAANGGISGFVSTVYYPLQEYLKTDSGKRFIERIRNKGT